MGRDREYLGKYLGNARYNRIKYCIVIPEEVKEEAFCGNEIWSDMIGKKLVSAIYSFELQEYNEIFPEHKFELIFEGDTGLTITDADHLDIHEAFGIHRMYMGWQSKYVDDFLKMIADGKISFEEGERVSELVADKKLSEKEAILKE